MGIIDGCDKSLARAERALARLQSERPINCSVAYSTRLADMGKVVAELALTVRTGEVLANDHKRVVRGLQVRSELCATLPCRMPHSTDQCSCMRA